MLRACAGVLAVLVLVRCGGADPVPPLPVAQGFTVQPLTAPPGPFAGTVGARVRMQEAMLGRPMLLSPVMVVASNTPQVDYLQPKVVVFERSGTQLALFETNPQALYTTLPSRKLIQTFAIVDSNAHGLSFDWHMGLEAVPLSDPLGRSDALTETVLTPSASFLRRATVQNETLELEQVSRITTRGHSAPFGIDLAEGTGVDEALTVTLITTLSLYNDTGYAPRDAHPLGFSVHPARQHLATRWDTRTPITYLIAPQTPADLVPVVREGVLYWNRVAGRTVVRVETPREVPIAPAPGQVVLHWADWNDAAFSEASLQANPLTGEIVHASVFLTSAFNAKGAELGRRGGRHAWQLRSPGFHSARNCQRPNHPPRIPAWRDAGNLAQRVAHDYVRGVVAHEVGHTLGLRHNFAANLDSQLPTAQSRTEAWQQYLQTGAGAGVASSVMDYPDDEDAALEGAFITQHALPYDVWAWRTLYQNATPETELHVCSDRDAAGSTADCRPWDSGRDPLAAYAARLADHNTLVEQVWDAMVDSLYPTNPEDAVALADLPEALAGTVPQDLAFAATQMHAFWRDDAQLVDVAPSDLLDVQRARLHALGGLPGIVRAIMPTDSRGLPETGWLRSAVARLMPSQPQCGRTVSGVDYCLDEDTLQDLHILLPDITHAVEQAILRDVLLGLTGVREPSESGEDTWEDVLEEPVQPMAYGLINRGWTDDLTGWLEHVLLSQDETKHARFAVDTRLAAIRWLSAIQLPWPEDTLATWAQTQAERLQPASFNPGDMPAEALRIWSDEQAVSAALGAAHTGDVEKIASWLTSALMHRPWQI